MPRGIYQGGREYTGALTSQADILAEEERRRKAAEDAVIAKYPLPGAFSPGDLSVIGSQARAAGTAAAQPRAILPADIQLPDAVTAAGGIKNIVSPIVNIAGGGYAFGSKPSVERIVNRVTGDNPRADIVRRTLEWANKVKANPSAYGLTPPAVVLPEPTPYFSGIDESYAIRPAPTPAAVVAPVASTTAPGAITQPVSTADRMIAADKAMKDRSQAFRENTLSNVGMTKEAIKRDADQKRAIVQQTLADEKKQRRLDAELGIKRDKAGVPLKVQELKNESAGLGRTAAMDRLIARQKADANLQAAKDDEEWNRLIERGASEMDKERFKAASAARQDALQQKFEKERNDEDRTSKETQEDLNRKSEESIAAQADATKRFIAQLPPEPKDPAQVELWKAQASSAMAKQGIDVSVQLRDAEKTLLDAAEVHTKTGAAKDWKAFIDAREYVKRLRALMPTAAPLAVVPPAAPVAQPPVVTPPPTSGPPAGTIRNGYRFKGGNPNDAANWEKT